MRSESKRTEAVTGTQSFKLIGYTLKKGMGVGNFIQSSTFAVGGYDWAIRFYPNGFNETEDYIVVYLELMSKKSKVRASYDLRLVNQATGLAESFCRENTPRVFRSDNASCLGEDFLIERKSIPEFKSAGYIVDDCLTIECCVTVIKKLQVSETREELQIEVPPSDLSEHFGKLLLEEEGADVTFSVGKETFPAHKIVLATRSLVFKAELYGKMKERNTRCVTVEDMQPDVFKALLKFIYTDSLPDWDDLDTDEYYEIVRNLLVAADRYAMDRLKLLCASILVEYLDVENVATMLALADQHNCDRLKDVCIEFMASSDEMVAVVKTEGYANIKRTCPSILIDVPEKTSKCRRT